MAREGSQVRVHDNRPVRKLLRRLAVLLVAALVLVLVRSVAGLTGRGWSGARPVEGPPRPGLPPMPEPGRATGFLPVSPPESDAGSGPTAATGAPGTAPTAQTIDTDSEPDPVETPVPWGTPDELMRVDGIGPKSRDALLAAGIGRLDQLAATDLATIRSALAAAGVRPVRSVDSWPAQAAALAQVKPTEGAQEQTAARNGTADAARDSSSTT